jgi:hypothetical protein
MSATSSLMLPINMIFEGCLDSNPECILSGKGRVPFSAKKCCVNVRKVMPRGKTEERVMDNAELF